MLGVGSKFCVAKKSGTATSSNSTTTQPQPQPPKTNWTSSQQSTQLTTTSTTNSTQLTTTSTTNSTQLTTTSTTNSTQLTTTSTTNPPTLPSNFSLKNSRKPLVGAVPSSYKVRQLGSFSGRESRGRGDLCRDFFSSLPNKSEKKTGAWMCHEVSKRLVCGLYPQYTPLTDVVFKKKWIWWLF